MGFFCSSHTISSSLFTPNYLIIKCEGIKLSGIRLCLLTILGHKVLKNQQVITTIIRGFGYIN